MWSLGSPCSLWFVLKCISLTKPLRRDTTSSGTPSTTGVIVCGISVVIYFTFVWNDLTVSTDYFQLGRLGEFDRDKNEFTERNVTYDEVYVHPTLDVAVIRLQIPQKFTKSIQPVSVRTAQALGGPKVGYKITVTGWGVVDPSTLEQARQLQELELTIVNKDECRARDRIRIQSDEMCAGFEQGKTYSNVCYGDSGGPIVHLSPGGRWVLVGIVKRGVRNCPQQFRYAVYTNISVVYDWIMDTTNEVYTDLGGTRCMKVAPFTGGASLRGGGNSVPFSAPNQNGLSRTRNVGGSATVYNGRNRQQTSNEPISNGFFRAFFRRNRLQLG